VNRRRIAVLEEIARRLFDEWFVHFRFPGHEGHEMVETEQGRLPNNWTIQPFSRIASFVNGYAFKPSDWGETGLPIIKIKELKEGVTGQTPRFNNNIDARYKVENGAVLFSWSADLEAYIWASGPAWLNQHLFVVHPCDAVRRAFMFLALRTQMPRFRALSQGTTMKHIKRSALDQVLIPVPPEHLALAFENLVGPILDLSVAVSQSTQRLVASRDLILPRLISGDLPVSAAESELESAA
jgi:type I restriction enzyme S subunit